MARIQSRDGSRGPATAVVRSRVTDILRKKGGGDVLGRWKVERRGGGREIERITYSHMYCVVTPFVIE